VDRHLLHILHGGRHQRLFRDVGESAQTAIAKPMELFSIREASLNRFFSFSVFAYAGHLLIYLTPLLAMDFTFKKHPIKI
jgi:hypothetical protein